MNGAEFTEQMRKMLPQWMKMAKDPNSVGAQFLGIFGLEFEDVQTYLDSVIGNQYIDTADLSQIDIAYKVPLALPIVADITNIDTVVAYKDTEKYTFQNVDTLRKFYTMDSTINTAILDRGQGIVYLRPSTDIMEDHDIYAPFEYIEINGVAHYDYSLHHVWNAFDEFGLLLGIDRLYGERNDKFKERILDVFRRPGNSTKDGLKNALSRELGIDIGDIEVNEFANPAFREGLLNSDGTPSQKLIGYVDQVNKVLGFTWDNMAWGEAYWRSIEENNLGLEYIPHVWDAADTGWKDEDFQSGIGDGNELLVSAPKEENNERNFKYYVGLRGRKNGGVLINPEISFKYKIVAKGSILNESYKPEPYKYTVVASEIVRLHFVVQASKKYWKTTVRDFNPQTPGYVPDINNGVEIVKGTSVMSNPSARYLKVKVEMATESREDTPTVEKIDIKWRDTQSTLRTFTLDSQVDFTRNDATVDTEADNVFITTDGKIQLGFGDYYNKIDTEGSWREGTATNIAYNREGSIQLTLPKW